MAAGVAAYFFTPFKSFADNVANQYGAALILAIKGKTSEVRNYIDSNVLPKDPEEQRKELIGELKNNLAQIKKSGLVNFTGQNSTTSSIADSAAIKKLLNDSEKIVNELEVANKDKTISQNATEKILDVILPIKEKAIECKN